MYRFFYNAKVLHNLLKVHVYRVILQTTYPQGLQVYCAADSPCSTMLGSSIPRKASVAVKQRSQLSLWFQSHRPYKARKCCTSSLNKVETSHLSAAEIEDKYTQIYINLCGAGLITVNLYSGAINIKYLSITVRDFKIYQLVFEELLVNVITLGYFWL